MGFKECFGVFGEFLILLSIYLAPIAYFSLCVFGAHCLIKLWIK